jgi:spermidine synthase
MSEWYQERWAGEGSALALEITAKLHDHQSPYQRVEVYETTRFGRLLTLDGLVMLTSRDNHIYHEMLAHPALYAHPDPRRVLIVGGGDCGTLTEVLRHPTVEHVDMVELDEAVTQAAERFFPELTAARRDPRAHLRFEDGIAFVAAAPPGSYDAILVDSTDPVGPAEGLFGEAFFRDCRAALTPSGVLATQSESPLFHADLIARVHGALRAGGFDHAASVHFPQCTYPSGWWSVTLGAKSGRADACRAPDPLPFPTRYYNAGVHRGALALPQELRARLTG